MNVLYDTTILVYAYDISEPRKREICKKIVGSVFRGENKGTVSNQILGELFVVLTKKIEKPLPTEKAEIIVNGIIESDNWIKINYNSSTIKKAIATSRQFRMHLWDAVIAETMLENSIFKICTENEKDFKKIPKIKAINPLR